MQRNTETVTNEKLAEKAAKLFVIPYKLVSYAAFLKKLSLLMLTSSVCDVLLWSFDVAGASFDTIVTAAWCCYPSARRCTTRDARTSFRTSLRSH